MPGDVTRLGPVYWIAGGALALLLTFALVFLEIVPWELLAPTFIIAWGGGQVLIMLALFSGGARRSGAEGFSMSIIAGLIGVILIIIESSLAGIFFNVSMAIDTSNGWLVLVLFAIYEETLFLGVRVAGKSGGLPDLWIMGLEALAFVPYHAFRYPLDMMFFIVFIFAVRMTLSGISLITDSSDPPYIAHMLYNFLVWLLR